MVESTLGLGSADASGRPSGYVPFIDGLRALAVLAVVAYHLDPLGLPGGFTGVDVFFVISGFVVSASVAAAPQHSLMAFAAWFYARRIRRIAPALVVCLLITGLVSALLVPPVWLSNGNARVGLMAFVGLSNLVLWRQDADYFAPVAAFNPYEHTWSLGVEEQFYLLFPLLFLAWLRGRRRLAFGLFLALALLSLACSVAYARSGQVAAGFYLLPGRFWQLAAGVLLYQWLAREPAAPPARRIGPRESSLLAFMALAALLAGLFLPRAGHVPWPDGLLPVIATVALIAVLLRGAAATPVERLLRSTPIRTIGLGSYSLYLWHWPVFVLMRWTIGLETAPQAALALALAAALAWASYRFVETPFRHGTHWRALAPARVLVVGLAGVVACGLLFRALEKHSERISLSRVAQEAAIWLPERAKPPGCIEEQWADPLPGISVWTFAPGSCGTQAKRPPVQVFVLGDSHALGYMAMLKALAAEGFVVRLYHRTGCPVLGLLDAREFDEEGCRSAIATGLADIRERAGQGDALLLTSARLPRLSSPWAPVMDLATAQARVDSAASANVRRRSEAWAAEALAPLAGAGVRVILEAPKPVLPAPPFRCVDAFNRSNPDCAGGLELDEAAFEALRAPALDTLERIAASLPAARVWDPAPFLCEDGACAAFWRGEPSFTDGDHLTAAATLRLLPDLCDLLLEPMPAWPAGARP